MLISDGLVGAVGLNTVGPTSRPVKRLGFVISDGRRQPSEITYVRRQPSDIALFPTRYLRRLKAVGDKSLPSEIIYFRRFIPYVRRLWPSDISEFTVVTRANDTLTLLKIFLSTFMDREVVISPVLCIGQWSSPGYHRRCPHAQS
jgi:hypothetical protein